ncbi:transcriptional activator DEMETER-like [Coffea arabica]|uniref:Transcriptional activator DEMETER-like n=1 Tax=Coffea arabica TaxID=13443 RepID=A0A6P6W7Y6_COFAR|nr:transcriptional activator DEMETER-like [Coffea arabica]
MDLGKGFLIPQENGVINNGDPCIPVTPEKPAMQMRNTVLAEMQGSLTKATNWQEQLGIQNRFSSEKAVKQTTYPIACEMQGDQVEGNNWLELLGIYSGVLQETPKNEALQNFNGAGLLGRGEHNIQDGAAVRTNGCFNQNAGSYTQNMAKDIPARNNSSLMQLLGIKNAPAILPIDGTPSRSIHGTDKFPFTSSDPPNQNKWTNYPSVNSMLLQQKSALPPNRGLMSSSLQQMPSDGFPVPYRPICNLNSPPREDTAASSRATSCFHFAPVTPDQGNLKNHQQSHIQNFSVDESLLQGKDKHEMISTDTEVGSYCNGLLHNVITSPSASNSKILTEKGISEDNVHGGIDLNKTPQQRPPRRKKHRPKVVVEKKPKRTPKPTASKANTSSENPSGKRRYVRRKGTDASNSGTENVSNGIEDSGVSSAAKSCRRVLNFDLEDKMHNQSQNWTGHNQTDALLKSKPFDLNLTCQETAWSAGCDPVSGMSSAKERQQIGCSPENQHGKSISNLTNSNNQKPAEKSLLLFPEASSPAARDHTLNVIARSLNLQNAAGQNNDESGHSQGHQHKLGDGTGQMILQENTASAKFDAARQLMWQTLTTSLKDTSQIYETRGSKRDYCHISEMTNPQLVDTMHSQLLSQDISKISKQKKDSSKNGLGTLELQKRKKLENECLGVASSISPSVKSVQDCSRQVESRGSNYTHASCSSSCQFGRLPNPDLEMQKSFQKQDSGCNGIASDGCNTNTAVANGFQEEESQSSVCLRLLNIRPKFQEKTASNTTDCLLHPTQGVFRTPGDETRTSPVASSMKKQTGVITSSIQAFRKKKVHPEENKEEIGSQRSSRKAKGQKEEQNYAAAVEEITHLLEALEISNSGNVVAKEQNAIVPYKGDGAIVSFEDPIKRRRPRPKVDLDPETNRVWNLLMGKAGSESTEPTDMEKEKWWANERQVVRGRVDSFIARMHLVQGDRRFSQWKGSVVDSVIGVFLTQNVSDHLSSSAFMSLAAKFPLPLTTFNANCCQNGAITWIEEPEVQIIDPDGTITYHGRMFSQPLYKRNSMTLSESSERRSDNLISETVSHLANDNTSGTEEEVVSSQNSCDSFLQATEDIRSSSESEVEDQKIRCNSNKNCSSGTVPKTERASKFKQYQCHGITNSFLDQSSMPVYQQQENPPCITQYPSSNDGKKAHANPLISDVLYQQRTFSSSSGPWLNKASVAGVHGPCSVGSLGQKSMSSFPHRSVEIANNAGVAHLPKKMGGAEGRTSSSTIQETGSVTKHAIAIDQTVSQNQQHKDDLQPGSHFLSSQQSISSNQVEASKSFELDGRSMMEPKVPGEADAQRQTGHLGSSSELLGSIGTKSSNARKKKQELEKTKSFDWDSLRKKVLSKGGKKERNKDTMDSLDYEALQNADVQKISETIRERGMNNMLAERIKDFLNRLVTEHGSIDLEWLRDVPADQAKDYLLSIRGLGLKSVECVRLLTLHQIAFPVDTNVGRIAVRLGWVPLQPLPESLQLHLLELYPVLESIQKYLWPRLCKLDQRTLYELHYQMITFGKVFCTKTKPNCNACPLRPECRHFASAFASARLALPAPEERSIDSSTTSVANGNASIVVKPMLLAPIETSEGLESQYIRTSCEPIIEEPTTPEPSSEVSESDIEDMFYEDPDEIPTIKLSFEELKMNVESVLQEQNMELQPGDVSRALVALDPSAASIPGPKLKSVSRLRTEHQVYELPDTHPLLEGMDRRERDDPSPYLLAIWSPGETANSTQPPASKCSLQGSGRLCNEKSCFMCHSTKEAKSETVRGTLLIPCRTAMRGSFPLNGTYFQVNEMFADHESSMNPIDVPRDWLWQLPRRTVYFGTSVTSIFRGLSTPVIQQCFWKGFVCVRGFDRKSRAPRPLQRRLHETASKITKNKDKGK